MFTAAKNEFLSKQNDQIGDFIVNVEKLDTDNDQLKQSEQT